MIKQNNVFLKYYGNYCTRYSPVKCYEYIHVIHCHMLYMQTCSNFQAGSKIRSKAKAAKLDTTAVFGSACRHEVPLLFMNMQHGERYVYVEHGSVVYGL